MAKCKCCQRKGFTVETDFNGLCSECAPYFQLELDQDVQKLNQLIPVIERIDHFATGMRNIEQASALLEKLAPYARCNLVSLPRSPAELAQWLKQQEEILREQKIS